MKLNGTTGTTGTSLTAAGNSIVEWRGSFAVAPARARLGMPAGLRRRLVAGIGHADRGNTRPSAAFDMPIFEQFPVPLLSHERCT